MNDNVQQTTMLLINLSYQYCFIYSTLNVKRDTFLLLISISIVVIIISIEVRQLWKARNIFLCVCCIGIINSRRPPGGNCFLLKICLISIDIMILKNFDMEINKFNTSNAIIKKTPAKAYILLVVKKAFEKRLCSTA